MTADETLRLRAWDYVLALAVAVAWLSLVRPGPISLPYFWDEADVYVPGARWVAAHGLDVTPGVFPDDYSRGHPPLLYLLAGAVFAIFGSAPAVGHLIVLPFTAVALAATYWLGAELYGRVVGACTALLLGATPLFMSIGNMLLPEVPLAAGTVLALFAYARGRLGVAVLISCALVLVKETGIFTGAAIGGAVLFDAWRGAPGRGWVSGCDPPRSGRERSRVLYRAALATLPLVTLLAFFAWQKAHAGYYVFPHHQHLFEERPLAVSNLATVFPSILGWHGRAFLLLAAASALVLGGKRALRVWTAGPRGSIVVAASLLLFFNAVFFSKMFWLERYALPVHPGVVVVALGAVAAGLSETPSLAERHRAPLILLLTTALVAVGVHGLWSATTPDAEEHTFAYADVIATHRAAFAELGPDVAVVATTWPLTVELETPSLGYVAEPRRTVSADALARAPDRPVDAVVINTASRHAHALREAAEARGLTFRRVHQIGPVPAIEVYTAPSSARAAAEGAR